MPLLGGFTWSDAPIYFRHRSQPGGASGGVVLSAGAPICNPACGHGVCTAQGASNICSCSGTGVTGPTCDTPVCTAPCVHGVCDAPEHCDCATTGYDGATCATDIDECTAGGHDCDPNATCTNTAGGFTCACNAGYTGDGVNCVDTDECATANGGCGPVGAVTCTNNVGAAPTCADIDGCAGAPCGAVTCADVVAPGTGYTCAVPDATSDLACADTTLLVDDATTCTITPRQAGVPISALASSFSPSATSGSVSAITPASGTSFTFTFTATAVGSVTVSDGLSSTLVIVTTDAGTTALLAGFDCQDLLDQGVVTSGTYWITANGSAPHQVYCEQVDHGGGWTLLFNSVGVLNGSTRAFWTIAYADRLTRKGTASLSTNHYDPTLYCAGGTFLDVAQSATASSVITELFQATASGIDPTTMAMLAPLEVTSPTHAMRTSVYVSQFATGWSAPGAGADFDTYPTANCATDYGTTQHYSNCWAYNLGSDADPPYADSEWGPHIAISAADALEIPRGTDGNYARLARISRFIKPHPTPASCLAWRNLGATTTGTYTIDVDGPGARAPFPVHCDMDWSGGGWTRVYYQDSNVGFFLEDGFTKNKDNPDAGVYAILADLESFRRGGAFELAMFWPGGPYTAPQHWSQSSNPVTDNAGDTPEGVVPHAISYTSNTSGSGWGGLQRSAGAPGSLPCLLDGTLDPPGNWYYAIGTKACWVGPFPGCQPGPDSVPQRYVELWVR